MRKLKSFCMQQEKDNFTAYSAVVFNGFISHGKFTAATKHVLIFLQFNLSKKISGEKGKDSEEIFPSC